MSKEMDAAGEDSGKIPGLSPEYYPGCGCQRYLSVRHRDILKEDLTWTIWSWLTWL